MRGQLWKTGWVAMAASLLAVGSALADLSDEQRREAILMGVAVEDDNDLRTQRATCDSGGLPAFKRDAEADGIPFPREDLFCRTVLREEAYRSRILTYMHSEDHAGIIEAVQFQRARYVDRDGIQHELNCERAYDAGYQVGWTRPHMVFQPTLEVDADRHAEQCFTSDSLHPALGFVAGVHHAQQDAR